MQEESLSNLEFKTQVKLEALMTQKLLEEQNRKSKLD